jgi:hypothetical protein
VRKESENVAHARMVSNGKSSRIEDPEFAYNTHKSIGQGGVSGYGCERAKSAPFLTGPNTRILVYFAAAGFSDARAPASTFIKL